MNCVCVRACYDDSKMTLFVCSEWFWAPFAMWEERLICLSVCDLVSAIKLANFHENPSRLLFQTVEQVTFRALWPSDSRGVLKGITEFVSLASSFLLATVVSFQFRLSVQQFVQLRVHTRVSCERLWHSVNKDGLVKSVHCLMGTAICILVVSEM
jgi:hypothetical protein